jgi:SNF2 family DNA or RNA helicase
MRLRKVCNHPSLILEDKENGDAAIRLPPELVS